MPFGTNPPMHKPGTLVRFKKDGMTDCSEHSRNRLRNALGEIIGGHVGPCNSMSIVQVFFHGIEQLESWEGWYCRRFDVVFEPKD